MKKLIFSILVFVTVFAVGCAGTQEPGTYGSEQLESEQSGSEQAGSERSGSGQAGSEQTGSEQYGSKRSGSGEAESLTDDVLKTDDPADISGDGGLVESGPDGIEENKDTALIDITAGAEKQTSETVSQDTGRQAEASAQGKDGASDLKTDQVSGEKVKQTSSVSDQRYEEHTDNEQTEEEVNGTVKDTYDDGLEASPEWVNKLPQGANAGQLVVIAATGGVGATVSMHEKAGDGSFRQILSTSGLIGKGGLGKTKEGDNKTPVGTFHFNKAFGILDDPGCAISYHKVTEYDYWSEDSGHYYNQLVDIRNVEGLDTANSDHIIDSPPFYDYCLNISYNEEGTPGKGSAIFLHCFGTLDYTHGCVAISRDQMKKLMQHVKPDCVVVIDSAKALGI